MAKAISKLPVSFNSAGEIVSYIHSSLDWQKDDIEYAIASYVDNMSGELLDLISDGRVDFLKDHAKFERDITQAVERMERMIWKS